ncbi:MAG: hypothetical protein RQ899_15075 [Pseudomonadales bacterium]|nr:hypothetical protein [Pseudomonadales bacterium]
MNRHIRNTLIFYLLLSQNSFAQLNESFYNLRHDEENGFYAVTIDDLIESSDIIVEGSYGEILSHQTFYGYGRSKEDVKQELNISEIEMSKIGLPMIEYEVVVDTVLKGKEKLADMPILRMYEFLDEHKKATIADAREGRHLFFFALNPDNITLTFRGTMYDMKEVGEAYMFLFNQVRMSAFGSYDRENFLIKIKEILNKPATIAAAKAGGQ